MQHRPTSVTQVVICLGAFLSNLSAGLFNIALVDIADSFGRSVTSAQWIVTVYLLTISVCLPLMGALGDRRGRARIHNFGYFLFMAGGLGCALSGSLEALIGFRVLQGFGASMYQATNMALVVSLFPPEKRGRALGMVSTFVAAGSLIGPGLGGIVVQWFSWRVNFWVLASAAFAAWMLAQRFIPRDAQGSAEGKLDLRGAALFGLALTALMTALHLGALLGWSSAAVWLLLAGSAALAAGFAGWSLSGRWAQGSDRPFIRLQLFDSPHVRFGILLTVAAYTAAFTAQVVLPVYLRGAMGIEPALAGLIVMAYPASLIVSAPVSGGMSDRYGSAPLLIAGLSAMTAALSALALLSPDSSLPYLVFFIVLLGTAMGMITSPNNSIVMSHTPKASLGVMSSMIALNRNLGMMFGAAAGGFALGAVPGSGGQAAAEELLRGVHFLFAALAALTLAALLLFLRLNVRKAGAAGQATAERMEG